MGESSPIVRRKFLAGAASLVGAARFGETALAGEARTVSDDLADINDLAGRMVSTLASRWGKMPISVSICSSCRAAGSFLG